MPETGKCADEISCVCAEFFLSIKKNGRFCKCTRCFTINVNEQKSVEKIKEGCYVFNQPKNSGTLALAMVIL
jgi:hypothetical protein